MKKIILKGFYLGLAIIMTSFLAASCSAKSWYVSSQGDDANKGTSEQKSFKTLAKAFSTASAQKGKCSIIITGVLNADSEGGNEKAVFLVGQTGDAFITITGKEGATEEQRAILSGADQELPILMINGSTNLRFENIEISGAPKNDGVLITGVSTVVLGKGVKIANNSGVGVNIEKRATLIMEGGEISGNQNRGVSIAKGCTFTMIDGKISHNSMSNEWIGGGGVFVDGTFVMEGGQISENQANSPGRGGGVSVSYDAAFTLKGGKIINNKAVGYSRNGGVNNGGAGGVYVIGGPVGKTTFIMEGGEISGNTAERYGGGVILGTDQGGKGTFTMLGGTITGNTAKGGGGMQNYGNRFTVKIDGGKITDNAPNDIDNGWNW